MNNRISKYIADFYGSKRGLLRYIFCLAQNVLMNKYSKNKQLPSDIQRIVFVCRGNICRSAFAEWFFKTNNTLACCSIGLDTSSGKGANERIRQISLNYGVSLDDHITTAVEDFTPEQGDLFVCMEPSQIAQLEKKIGKQNVVLLGFWGNPKKPYIHDPYNANAFFADGCIKYILSAVAVLSTQLNNIKTSKAC